MSDANKAVVQQLVEGLWNKGDIGVFEALFADDFIDRNPMPGMEANKAAFRQLVLGFQAAFSGTRVTADDIIAEGDKVAWRWTFRGTHTGPLMGIPPTGKSVTITGYTFDRIANGQVAERWHQIDMAGMMQQLGVGN
jgi:steroid delta-isomerase-like uncharacterized protein